MSHCCRNSENSNRGDSNIADSNISDSNGSKKLCIFGPFFMTISFSREIILIIMVN